METKLWSTILLIGVSFACSRGAEEPAAPWRLSEESQSRVGDEALADQIYRALDAAAGAGTEPSISQYPVRAATVVEHQGKEHIIVGGNTEYQVPEAIHGENPALFRCNRC